MILLDTNILSEPMRPSPNEGVISWPDQQIVTGLFICSITKVSPLATRNIKDFGSITALPLINPFNL